MQQKREKKSWAFKLRIVTKQMEKLKNANKNHRIEIKRSNIATFDTPYYLILVYFFLI